ncbi:MAG: RNA 3'-terminal phosphate cyclase [Planctomycetota bacterium]|nr:RNA 3'-terminal phosphate cyclase [Planctomycetota bacterium]
MSDPVTIDGSRGEGGGQVLRTALALSLATGRPLRLFDIRAGRAKPGLRRQHVTAVEAARDVGGAHVEGAEIGSRTLSFEPAGCFPGTFRLHVGTAGSACLVIQTVLPVLLFAGAPSRLIVTGGTHTHFAPPFEYLSEVYLPLLRRLGADVSATLEQAGFFPAGGGRIRVDIGAADAPRPFELLERGRHGTTDVRALLANLPRHIAERELAVAKQKLALRDRELRVVPHDDAIGPGNALLVRMEHEHVTELFTAYGKRGVSAERVAAAACREAKAWAALDAPVGPHLADQLMLPLALGAGGVYRTGALTPHAETNLGVIGEFLDRRLEAEPLGDGRVDVRIGLEADGDAGR